MIISISNMPYLVSLGKQGESNFKTLRFDISEWADKYKNGTAKIYYENPEGIVRVTAESNIANGVIAWDVTAQDTDVPGRGKAEIKLEANGIVGKPIFFATNVSPSVSANERTAAGSRHTVAQAKDYYTKAEVDSAIHAAMQNKGGNFIGSFDSLESLYAYSGKLINNDYAYVRIINGIYAKSVEINKYIYANGKWLFAHTINGGE